MVVFHALFLSDPPLVFHVLYLQLLCACVCNMDV